MKNLKITLIQPDILWENIQANLDRYSAMIAEIEQTDVIVLPEMFTTGFSMNPENLKETVEGKSVKWMKKMAVEKNAAVTGSLIIGEKGKIYNRILWVFPDGQFQSYDKRHLFTMGDEHKHYDKGYKKLIVEYKGWKFCPLVCYDLRFPVWSRNAENYDVLIYVANWPAARRHVWKNLLVARAIENQSYCVGVNRVGIDGNGVEYSGDSALISPKGKSFFIGKTESIQTFDLSLPELRNFRNKFPVLNDKDQFSIHF